MDHTPNCEMQRRIAAAGGRTVIQGVACVVSPRRSRVLQYTWDVCPSRRYVPKGRSSTCLQVVESFCLGSKRAMRVCSGQGKEVPIGAFPRAQVELGAIMIRS